MVDITRAVWCTNTVRSCFGTHALVGKKWIFFGTGNHPTAPCQLKEGAQCRYIFRIQISSTLIRTKPFLTSVPARAPAATVEPASCWREVPGVRCEMLVVLFPIFFSKWHFSPFLSQSSANSPLTCPPAPGTCDGDTARCDSRGRQQQQQVPNEKGKEMWEIPTFLVNSKQGCNGSLNKRRLCAKYNLQHCLPLLETSSNSSNSKNLQKPCEVHCMKRNRYGLSFGTFLNNKIFLFLFLIGWRPAYRCRGIWTQTSRGEKTSNCQRTQVPTKVEDG